MLQKARKSRCAKGLSCLNDGSNLLGKEAIYLMKLIKAIMILAVAAGILSLGACAQKKETTASTSGTSSTYSK